ncbi:MAG: diadenylate cyclase [Planctomycetota bacterium]
MNFSESETDVFAFVQSASRLAKSSNADAVLLLIEEAMDWAKLKKKSSSSPVSLLLATPEEELAESAREAGLTACVLESAAASVQDQLTQAVLASVAEESLRPGSTVVAIYSGFDATAIDSISVVRLSERLGRLTARDLKKLKTKVPLDTLRTVVDLAVQIGRDGREGSPVGTMFVVGDHRKVLENSRPGGFDVVKGYTRKERSIHKSAVREGIKEIAQLDGMFVVAADGTIEASSRIIDTQPVEITMTTGLGSRHFAGAAISKTTKAIAVVVSQTSGTVRIFQNGEVVLRIEPLERAMKWKDFESEQSTAEAP